MSKQSVLKKRVIIRSMIMAAIVATAGFIAYMAMDYEETKIQEKASAEAALSADQAKINELRKRISNSGTSEKRFLEIQESRSNVDFAADAELMKNWLRAAITHHRISQRAKLLLTPEIPTAEPNLKSTDYSVVIHPDSSISLEAISDLHIVSFLEEMSRSSPGVIRFEKLTLTRKGNIDVANLRQIQKGGTPYLAQAEVQFSWIGVTEVPKAASQASTGVVP